MRAALRAAGYLPEEVPVRAAPATINTRRGYTPREIGHLLRVSAEKVRRWIAAGELRAINTADRPVRQAAARDSALPSGGFPAATAGRHGDAGPTATATAAADDGLFAAAIRHWAAADRLPAGIRGARPRRGQSPVARRCDYGRRGTQRQDQRCGHRSNGGPLPVTCKRKLTVSPQTWLPWGSPSNDKKDRVRWSHAARGTETAPDRTS